MRVGPTSTPFRTRRRTYSGKQTWSAIKLYLMHSLLVGRYRIEVALAAPEGSGRTLPYVVQLQLASDYPRGPVTLSFVSGTQSKDEKVQKGKALYAEEPSLLEMLRALHAALQHWYDGQPLPRETVFEMQVAAIFSEATLDFWRAAPPPSSTVVRTSLTESRARAKNTSPVSKNVTPLAAETRIVRHALAFVSRDLQGLCAKPLPGDWFTWELRIEVAANRSVIMYVEFGDSYPSKLPKYWPLFSSHRTQQALNDRAADVRLPAHWPLFRLDDVFTFIHNALRA